MTIEYKMYREETEHLERMIKICQKVVRVSERQFADTGKHRHDYEVALNKLPELTLRLHNCKNKWEAR